MQAPADAGTYKGYWQLRTPGGQPFGEQATVVIVVRVPVEPTATERVATMSILIHNRTGESLVLNLTGPRSYKFTLVPGDSTIDVVPGTYAFVGTGCGGATRRGTKSFESGQALDWDWWCD